MDIKKLTIVELEALAYKAIKMISMQQSNLKIIEAEIESKNKTENKKTA